MDNPQAHGYQRAFHPGEGFNIESTGRKVERKVWSKRLIPEKLSRT
jgi:hypothetical protein